MKPLSPSFAVIQARILGPSDELIERWAEDDPDISNEYLDRLEADPVARERRDQWLEPLPEPAESAEVASEEQVAMPAVLMELVEQKVAARTELSQEKPIAGQILRIDGVSAPEGALDATISQPMAVLIDHKIERQVWAGWMASSETEYASTRDLLLDDNDMPVDPLVGMIQTWNPVRVSVPSTGRVLAQLSAKRLAAVRDMLKENDPPYQLDIDVEGPGAVIEWRTKTGSLVLTGTPLGDGSDPRRRFQELYQKVAAMITKAAAAPAVQPSLLERLIAQLSEAAERLGESLTIRPLVPQALGDEEDKAKAFDLGDVARLTIFPPPAEDTVQVRVEVLGNHRLQASVSTGELITQTEKLGTEKHSADFFLTVGKDRLRVMDESGTQRLEWAPRTEDR